MSGERAWGEKSMLRPRKIKRRDGSLSLGQENCDEEVKAQRSRFASSIPDRSTPPLPCLVISPCLNIKKFVWMQKIRPGSTFLANLTQKPLPLKERINSKN